MRRVVGSGALLLAAALCLSCDSDSPATVGPQTFSLTVSSPNAVVEVYTVWNLIRDADINGQPDDVDGDGEGDVTLWCQRAFMSGQPVNRSANSVPWPFAVEISVIRAGETQRETLVSALQPGDNQALYDQSVNNPGLPGQPMGFSVPAVSIDESDCGQMPETNCGNNLGLGETACAQTPGCVIYRFSQARNLTEANAALIFAEANLLNALAPMKHGGNCQEAAIGPNAAVNLADYGPPRIDGVQQPFTVTLDKGDTIFVEARRFDVAPPDVAPGGLDVMTEPGLSAMVTLDGLAISGDVQGSTSTGSPVTTGEGFSFSFTSR